MDQATNEQQLRIRNIITCACKQHAIVRLDPLADGAPLYIRTSIEMASAIHASDIALPTVAAHCIRALADCLGVVGAAPTAAVLVRDQREVRLRLYGAAMDLPTEIDLDPGVTLLAAKVLRLPIILAEAAVPSLEADDRTDLPPVFRELLASLDLREDVPPDHHSA